MGKVADRYRRRAASVGPETHRLRGDVGKAMFRGLQDATEEELYARTPLPVSRKLFRSISIAFHGNSVQVFFSAAKARHARKRINMKGTSESGGHRLDMNPAAWLRKNVDPYIKRRSRQAQRRIIEK